jgi:SAM-dependent MidA family methyltransferase
MRRAAGGKVSAGSLTARFTGEEGNRFLDAAEVRRVAKERHLTLSRALVSLAEREVQAELDAKANLQAAYRRFIEEQEPALKEVAGRDLIRAIFGKDAIAENSLI